MTAALQPSIVKPAELAADLDALQRLPPSTLAKLIDPSAAPTPKPANAITQLAAFGPSCGPDASLALTTAYAAEMREGATKLRAQEIGGPASAIAGGRGAAADLATLERIRSVAEEVQAAVEERSRLSVQRARTAALALFIRNVDASCI
ncbi:hypothetical protein CspeluHIS016_0309720 [Cutaneotrichosporon spelunceum]|uniref:Uncharacterized protein n=1 Tax=Cutaneotrichosporon spelunceum TaxID=1672016 RepID=A0AAD3TVA4_9TREE|nr:hypothetical protein CspeluHIS016_0309720 [Cutaneotrichosporon spelunceum]